MTEKEWAKKRRKRLWRLRLCHVNHDNHGNHNNHDNHDNHDNHFRLSLASFSPCKRRHSMIYTWITPLTVYPQPIYYKEIKADVIISAVPEVNASLYASWWWLWIPLRVNGQWLWLAFFFVFSHFLSMLLISFFFTVIEIRKAKRVIVKRKWVNKPQWFRTPGKLDKNNPLSHVLGS